MANRPGSSFPGRIRKTEEYRQISRHGSRIYPCSWMILNYRTSTIGQNRFGWTVPKFVGPAVVRNRLKRWCREVVRRQAGKVETGLSADVNIVLKRQPRDFYRNLSFEQFQSELRKGLAKLQRKLEAK